MATKVIVRTWDDREIEITIRDYLTYKQRNDLLNEAKIKGDEIEGLGNLMQKTLETVILKVPEGIDWNKDIRTEDLDTIFGRFSSQFGLGKKKVTEQ